MDWFIVVKRHYDAGRYTDTNVSIFVIGNKITPTQYETITGQVYEAAA